MTDMSSVAITLLLIGLDEQNKFDLVGYMGTNAHTKFHVVLLRILEVMVHFGFGRPAREASHSFHHPNFTL